MDSFANLSRSSVASWATNVTSTCNFNVLGESEHHTLQAYPSVLPVLLIEAISLEASPHRTISVNLGKDGWAWLVCGRRLFVWKYVQGTKSKIESYELQLPSSDLLHKADLIRLIPPQNVSSTHATPGVIAVSPEGIIRYWPNAAHPAISIENRVGDLQGQEFYLLIDVTPCHFILGTTTSLLSLVYISNNNVMCNSLKAPQGVLAGFSRRVQSMLGFGAIAHTTEDKPLIKIICGSIDSRNAEICVLAGSFLQQWIIMEMQMEKLVTEHNLSRVVTDAFLTNVWSSGSAHPNQIKLMFIDMIEHHNDLLLLVSAVNQDSPNLPSFAIVVIGMVDLSAPTITIKHFTTLKNYTPSYANDGLSSGLQELGPFRMIPHSQIENLIYIFNKDSLLCVDWRSDVMDSIFLTTSENFILGAGSLNDNLLFFTSKDNLVQIIPKESLCTLMGGQNLSFGNTEISIACDCTIDTLKNAFRLYRRGEKRESMACCSQLVSNFMSAFDSNTAESTLDEMVVAISKELCDESPSADPRWAESIGTSSNFDVISALLSQQLEDKLRIHLLFLEFLRKNHIWDALSLISYNGITHSTQHVLCQHTEKIYLAITLKRIQDESSDILDMAIRKVADERGLPAIPHLTELDIFYQRITSIHEIFPMIIVVQEQKLHGRIDTAKDCLNTVIEASNIMITSLMEIRRFHQSQVLLYESCRSAGCEIIPLTATGIRPVLLRQLEMLVQCAGRSDSSVQFQEEEVQLKSIIYKGIMDLGDIVFESYRVQLESIDVNSDRYQLVMKNFEQDRLTCLKPLLKAKQFERLTALGEKYEDFDTLIQICEIQDNRTKLRRYIEEYRDKGFSEFLFKWYMKEGKLGKMLDTKLPELGSFLSERPDINWIHYIGMGQFHDAALSLKFLGENQTGDDEKKRLHFSLSKLCLLAEDGINPDELEQINDELKRLDQAAPVAMSSDNLKLFQEQ
ncbi:nuclear pore complex protein Nup133 [Brevipalpus obovatus]|uniref:nuclear pore complex protein Nup133 n=1 Tax=Brevipalpus obovatus TaxID=246614 RepID=UPI003D9F9306